MDQYRTSNTTSQRDGIKQRYQFANGWGASVVSGQYTYGGDQGLWELAVLDRRGKLDYTTSITNDVLGWLTWDEVQTALQHIAALPTAPEV